MGEISKVSMLRKSTPIIIDHHGFEMWLGLLFLLSLTSKKTKKAHMFSDWLLMPAVTRKRSASIFEKQSFHGLRM